MKLPTQAVLSLPTFLVTLGLTMALAAQQPQSNGIPANAQWFPGHPIGFQSSTTPATQTEMEPMPLVAPIFVEDAKTHSSLVIANDSAINAGATVTVRSLSGGEVGTVHKKLAPHEQQEISLESLLAGFASPIEIGSITVTQDANLKGMTVASQLLLTEYRWSLPSYVDEELAMPSVSGSATLRGVADEAAGTALIAITSIVNWEQHVTLRCLAEKAENKPATITIAPYATSVVSSCSGEAFADMDTYTQDISQHPASGIQGYELVSDGGPGAITAFGLAPHLRDKELIFSAVPFTDPAEIHSPNSVFAGVPFGPQDALPNGIYKPRISFTNFATTRAHITISIAATRPGDLPVSTTPGDSPEKVTIRQLTIAPRRSVELALSDTVSQSGLLQSLFVETDKKPGEVLGKAISRSDGNLYEVELLEKDQMDENNGGIHPWSVEGDSESHLLFFNHSKKPQVFGVGIWNGAILWDKKYTLAPNETREISINELIKDEVPDGKGQVLRPGHERGVVNWMVPDSGNATGRLMVTSRSKGMARNFSCGNFIVVCGLTLDTYNSGVIAVGDVSSIWYADTWFCDQFSPSQCSGGSRVGSGSGSYSWSIGATNILKASSSAQLTSESPEVTGVSPGRGGGSVEVKGGSCSASGYGGGAVEAEPNVTVNTGGTIHYGQLPNISATVSASSGPVPTGEVLFEMEPAAVTDDTTYPLKNGVASWDLAVIGGGPLIPVGSYKIYVNYGGDDNYVKADGTNAFAVDKADSTSTIASCPSSVTAGQSQSLKISVEWATPPAASEPLQPTGQVILTASPYSGSATQAPPGTLSLNYGAASTVTIPITLTAKGSYTVKAAYQGDDNYVTSTSEQCAITVK